MNVIGSFCVVIAVFLCVSEMQNPRKEMVDQLHNFCAQGDTTKLFALLSHSSSIINETSENGWSALMFAARNGHFDVVTMLLEKG